MHTVIRIIVEADNKEDALSKAENVLERLCGEDKTFDYYAMFNKEDVDGQGKSRWGELPACVRTNSKKGAKLIKEGMEATKDEFFSNLGKIRRILSTCADEEIFEGRIIDDKTKMLGVLTNDTEELERQIYSTRYAMYCCGEYRGSSIWLYDGDGNGIRNESDLKHTLTLGATERSSKPKMWVVPADVHH